MDVVFNALRHYRLSSSPAKKTEDIERLERECLSTIDARQYVQTITIQSKNPSLNCKERTNYNLNPDYNLDFSLFYHHYGYTRCFCL